ncbi:phage tail tape measure protein [Celerinatantimonas sp. MCCC 1A17872]|uniref:phage tail tape measure protein n=1 Tax=Celerinatantimonas sp. MCCC 1A17872 TaxID=3177514 RepID=UPI0038C0DC2E
MANDLKIQIILKAVDKALKPIRAITQGSGKLSKQLQINLNALKKLNTQQRDVQAFRRQNQALQTTQNEYQQARQTVKQLGKAMAQTESPTRAQVRGFERAKRGASRLKEQYNQQRLSLEQMRRGLNQSGLDTRHLSQHERSLRRDIEQTNSAINAQKNRLRGLAQQQEKMKFLRNRYRRNQRFTGTMAANGAGTLAAGTSYLFAGKQLLSPGVDFAQAMSHVQALTQLSGNSKQLKALRDQARALGASTQYTAVDAANAQGFLAMAGFNPKAIRQTMPSMLNLAKAGNLDLGETADISSNILSGFGLQSSEMTRVADVLTKTSITSNTNLQMLGQTMKFMAPVAKAAGMSLEQAASMAGLLGNVGIQASQAGTTLRAMLLRLSSPTQQAAKMMKKLGVSAVDAKGNVRAIPDVLQDVAKATAKMGNGKRLNVLKQIFGEEPAAGMAELLDQAGIGGLKKYITQVSNYQGTAAKVAHVMADNLGGDLKTLGSGWQDLGIEIETQQDGPLRSLVQNITSILHQIKDWVHTNPKLAATLFKLAGILTTIMVVGGALTLTLASLLGPLFTLRFIVNILGLRLGFLSSIFKALALRALPMVGQALLWLGRILLANPIGLAITAIGTAAYLIYRYWSPIKRFFSQLWSEIKQDFSGGLKGILKFIADFNPLALFYRAFAGVLSYFGIKLPAKMTDCAKMVIQGFLNGLGLGAIKDRIMSIGSNVISWFKQKLGIHSPSRVFAELGGYTMAGLDNGLRQSARAPLKTMRQLGQQLTQQGAQALSFQSANFDSRAPLRSNSSRQVSQTNHFSVTIAPAPGMDPAAIGREVQRQLAQFQQQLAVNQRSQLSDED